MNRQSLASLLVGIFSVVAGLWVATQLRIQRCLDADGRWDAARRACALPEGAETGTLSLLVIPYALGALVTLVSAVVLLRLWTAMSMRRPPSGPPSTPKQPAP